MYTVDLSEDLLITDCEEIFLEYFYLESNDYEKRIKKRTQNNQTTYYLTIQKREIDGTSKIIMDKKITEKEANKMLSTYKIISSLEKTRYCFSKNKQYFKLDVFPDSDIGLLQVDVTTANSQIILPQELKILKEVTNNLKYQSFNISMKKNDKIKKM